METAYPLVPLSVVVTPVGRPLAPKAGVSYRQVGVRLWGCGAYERELMDGGSTEYRTLYQVESDDLIVNKIWARNGSVAVIAAELAGAVVSGEFPTYKPDRQMVEPRWLHWLTKTPAFWQQCDDRSQGTSGKNRIRPEQFLSVMIPLPPLSEQQRIVARIEALAGKIEEAKRLREASAGEIEQLKSAEEMRIWPDSVLKDARSLSEVTTYLTRGRQSQQGDSQHFLIKTQHVQMGRYLQSSMTLDAGIASRVSADAIARPGDILIACSAAGCLGRVAFYDDPERTASTDTHVAIARPNEEVVHPDYLYAYLLGAQGQRQIRSREKGDWQREKVGFRLTELNLKDLEQVPVPVPPRNEQARIVTYLKGLNAKADALQSLQQHVGAALQRLLPAVLDRAFRGEL